MGEGVSEDETKAFYWYTKAAKQGSSEAQVMLGRCYLMAQGVHSDVTKAIFWFDKSAKQGNPDAQCILGNMYYSGLFVEQSKSKGAELIISAAKQGQAEAKILYRNLEEIYKRIDIPSSANIEKIDMSDDILNWEVIDLKIMKLRIPPLMKISKKSYINGEINQKDVSILSEGSEKNKNKVNTNACFISISNSNYGANFNKKYFSKEMPKQFQERLAQRLQGAYEGVQWNPHVLLKVNGFLVHKTEGVQNIRGSEVVLRLYTVLNNDIVHELMITYPRKFANKWMEITDKIVSTLEIPQR